MIHLLSNDEINIETTVSKLRVQVNDNWSPKEFSIILNSINYFYNLRLVFSNLETKVSKDGFTYFILNRSLIKDDEFSKDTVNALLVENFMRSGISEIEPKVIELISESFKKELQLDLFSINYNSPGSLDLLGLGKIMEVIKDFILKLKELNFEKQKYQDQKIGRDIERRRLMEELELLISSKSHNELENKIAISLQLEELRKKRLDFISSFIDLAKRKGIPKKSLSSIIKKIDLDYEKLNELIAKGKIEDVKIVDDYIDSRKNNLWDEFI